jgi:hypothetical protein
MSEIEQPIAVIDDESTIIYGYDDKFIISTKAYNEAREAIPIPPQGELIRPIAIIDYLSSGDNPVTLKAMVAREVEIQRQDDKNRQNMMLFILAGMGIMILCSAIAYIMITKSADVASVAVQTGVDSVSTGTGVAIK